MGDSWHVIDGLGGIPVCSLEMSENGSLRPSTSVDGAGKDALEGLPAFFFFKGGGDLSTGRSSSQDCSRFFMILRLKLDCVLSTTNLKILRPNINKQDELTC